MWRSIHSFIAEGLVKLCLSAFLQRALAWKIDCLRPLFTSDIYNLKPLRNILSVVSSPNIFSLHIQVGSNANRFIYITVSQSFSPSLSFLLFIECQRPGIFLFHLFNGIIPDLQPSGSIFRLPEVIFPYF